MILRVAALAWAAAPLSLSATPRTVAPIVLPEGLVASTPADVFGPLYRAVELEQVFADSKTFADAIPRRDAGAILADYRKMLPSGPALRRFVAENFLVPAPPPPPAQPVAGMAQPSLADRIAALWPALARRPGAMPAGSSALGLPQPYVVPGGRFREIYYWDSYFTMLGLARDGRGDLVEAMIDDFTTLIERYGHIPNGTRSYYLSRSQPPVYYLMLGLSANRDPRVFRRRLAALRREHDYWMRGAAGLKPGQAAAHVARLADGTLLNRYWDARETPRDESYAEDVETAGDLRGPAAAALYRELRAGAESGWDYSSRWLGGGPPAAIRVTTLAPVDLNSLMVGMEQTIAAACGRIGDAACARGFQAQATKRAAAIRRTMWTRQGWFADLDWKTGRTSPILTAATGFPLFVGIATPAQASATAATMRARLLAPGGLRTTLSRTGQQWDVPNGWAPLQWIAVSGLRRYRQETLAGTIATRWIATVDAGYRATGALVEKYDVEVRSGAGRGGEYPNQIGFGWTNGVTRALIGLYGSPVPPTEKARLPDREAGLLAAGAGARP